MTQELGRLGIENLLNDVNYTFKYDQLKDAMQANNDRSLFDHMNYTIEFGDERPARSAYSDMKRFAEEFGIEGPKLIESRVEWTMIALLLFKVSNHLTSNGVSLVFAKFVIDSLMHDTKLSAQSFDGDLDFSKNSMFTDAIIANNYDLFGRYLVKDQSLYEMSASHLNMLPDTELVDTIKSVKVTKSLIKNPLLDIIILGSILDDRKIAIVIAESKDPIGYTVKLVEETNLRIVESNVFTVIKLTDLLKEILGTTWDQIFNHYLEAPTWDHVFKSMEQAATGLRDCTFEIKVKNGIPRFVKTKWHAADKNNYQALQAMVNQYGSIRKMIRGGKVSFECIKQEKLKNIRK